MAAETTEIHGCPKSEIARGSARGLGATTVAALVVAVLAGCQGTVDQEQLVVTGALGVGAYYTIGQTFTAGCSGPLTGIELGVMRGEDYTYPDMTLNVSGSGGLLGTASIPSAPLPVSTVVTLSHDTTGPGLFDFAAQSIQVTAGESYSFEVQTAASLAGACDTEAGSCTAGRVGQACDDEFDCSLWWYVSDTDTDPYAGGTQMLGGSPRDGFDHAFKTFVLGCTVPT